MDFELSTPSEDVLGRSEVGDFIGSPRGCLLSDALIARGMHFEWPEDDSFLSSAEFNCLNVLQN